MTVSKIELHEVSKTFHGEGESLLAVQDVSLAVMPGEFVTLIGPSGSGKSTLFNLIVGLLEPDSGDILIDGRPTTADQRTGHIGYMPQKDLLLPWQRGIDNAILPLVVQGIPRAAASRRARELI